MLEGVEGVLEELHERVAVAEHAHAGVGCAGVEGGALAVAENERGGAGTSKQIARRRDQQARAEAQHDVRVAERSTCARQRRFTQRVAKVRDAVAQASTAAPAAPWCPVRQPTRLAYRPCCSSFRSFAFAFVLLLFVFFMFICARTVHTIHNVFSHVRGTAFLLLMLLWSTGMGKRGEEK